MRGQDYPPLSAQVRAKWRRRVDPIELALGSLADESAPAIGGKFVEQGGGGQPRKNNQYQREGSHRCANANQEIGVCQLQAAWKLRTWLPVRGMRTGGVSAVEFFFEDGFGCTGAGR